MPSIMDQEKKFYESYVGTGGTIQDLASEFYTAVLAANPGTVTITGGTITGITDLAIADGGTGASTAAAARTNLGFTDPILDKAAPGAIGGTTPAAVSATTLSSTSAVANGLSVTSSISGDVTASISNTGGVGASFGLRIDAGSTAADYGFRVRDKTGATTLFTVAGDGTVTTGIAKINASYTVATLPAGSAGMRAHVTDALAPTFLGALTGGGAVVSPVFHNGTAWVAG